MKVLFIVIILVLIGYVITKAVVYYHMEYLFPLKIDPDKKSKILVIGDSITFGMFLFNRKKNRYSNLLEKKLNKEVVNMGVNGAVVHQDMPRSFINHEYYKMIKDYSFETLIIDLGANDSKDYYWQSDGKFIEDFDVLIKALRTLQPQAELIIVGVIPFESKFNNKVPFYGLKNDKGIIINNLLREYSESYDYKFVDLYPVFQTSSVKLSLDGAHPNKKGHEIIAQEIINTIQN